MGKDLNKQFSKNTYASGRETHEKMLSIVREMKIKTTMRYHFIPTRMALIRSHWLMLQCGWTLKALCCVQEAAHKGSHAVWPCFSEMPTTGKSVETESRSALSRLKTGQEGHLVVEGRRVSSWVTKMFWNWLWRRSHKSVNIPKLNCML